MLPGASLLSWRRTAACRTIRPIQVGSLIFRRTRSGYRPNGRGGIGDMTDIALNAEQIKERYEHFRDRMPLIATDYVDLLLAEIENLNHERRSLNPGECSVQAHAE